MGHCKVLYNRGLEKSEKLGVLSRPTTDQGNLHTMLYGNAYFLPTKRKGKLLYINILQGPWTRSDWLSGKGPP